jgi:ribose transport system permease protein
MQPASALPATPAKPARTPSFVQAGFLGGNEFGLIVLICVFATIFSLATKGFASPFNLFTLGRTMAIDIVIGFSMMVVIVSGGLNLAVGAIGVCAVMAGGYAMERLGFSWPLGFAVTLLVGAALGAVNGETIVRSGVHSFIITLATMSIFFGGMVFLSRAEAFRELPPEITQFGKMRLMGFLSPLLLVSIATSLLLAWLYRLTSLGRRMLAAGASPRAAEVSGIRVDRTIVACHVLSGMLAALAGAMLTARHGAAIPSMAGHLGQDWLLPAFLAPVLGGTLLTGGKVSVLGTFLGAMLVSTLTNGLLLLRVGEFWVQAFLGLLLLAAVLLDLGRRRLLARHRIAA